MIFQRNFSSIPILHITSTMHEIRTTINFFDLVTRTLSLRQKLVQHARNTVCNPFRILHFSPACSPAGRRESPKQLFQSIKTFRERRLTFEQSIFTRCTREEVVAQRWKRANTLRKPSFSSSSFFFRCFFLRFVGYATQPRFYFAELHSTVFRLFDFHLFFSLPRRDQECACFCLPFKVVALFLKFRLNNSTAAGDPPFLPSVFGLKVGGHCGSHQPRCLCRKYR